MSPETIRRVSQTASPSAVLANTGTLVHALHRALSVLAGVFPPGEFIVTTPQLCHSFMETVDATTLGALVGAGDGDAEKVFGEATDSSNAVRGQVGKMRGIPVVIDSNVSADTVGDSSYQSGVAVMSRRRSLTR